MKRGKHGVALAVVMQGGMILMVKRKDGVGGVSWAFPGGKIEVGEQVEQAAQREVFEEAGVVCEADRSLGLRVHPSTGEQIHYLLCNYISGREFVREPRKVSDVQWMTPDEIKAQVTSPVYEGVLDHWQELLKMPATHARSRGRKRRADSRMKR